MIKGAEAVVQKKGLPPYKTIHHPPSTQVQSKLKGDRRNQYSLEIKQGFIINMLFVLYIITLALDSCLSVNLNYSVEELKRPGTIVGNIMQDSKVVASIPTKDRSQVTFIQLNQDTDKRSPLFQVNRTTGKLTTMAVLDAETMCKRNTECFRMLDIAIQKGSSTLKIVEVKINIIDVNDHRPEFPDKQVRIEFSEGDGVGIRKSIPNANDKDVGAKNSNVTYKLIKQRDEPFALNELKNVAGKSYLSITLEKRLDREMKDNYQIQVVAKDGGSPPKQSVLNIYISITDVNDNTPVFTKDIYKVTAKNEPLQSIPIASVSASDLDAGKNGRVSYHFSSETPEKLKSFFELKKLTGEIFLVKKFTLDQEATTHNLFIEATDEGSPPLSSLTKFQVNVVGQENSAPIININYVSKKIGNTVQIPEDIKDGGFISYVKVTDNDIGPNGDVTCDLQHRKFELQNLGVKKYKVILKSLLDREFETHFDIEIQCQDKGSPPLQSKSKFSIEVTDVNDVRPQFSMETFKFFIEENEKSRFSVGFINATDPDLGLGGKLTYSLLTNNKQFLPFKIKDDGMISAIMSLDHEFENIYKFQVFVKDNGIPSLNNTVNVIVEVTDKNDNAPYFTFPSVNPYNMDVIYYPHHTKNISQIKASDSDSQENAFLKYEIIRGNSKQIFTINQYTGLLCSTHVLSQQDAGSYELEFLVKDSGSPVLSARTTVYLTLTVSNKTSEMLNAVNIKKDNKIHLISAIIIVSVAVIIAVIITVSISVCILQCNRQKSMSCQKQVHPSNRSVHDQKHFINGPPPPPSYHKNSLHHAPVSVETTHTLSRNNQVSKPKYQIVDSSNRKQKTLKHSHKPKSSTELPLLRTQNVSITHNYISWKSSVSSTLNHKHHWNEKDIHYNNHRQDLLPSKPCMDPSAPLIDPLTRDQTYKQFPKSRNQPMTHKHISNNNNNRPLPPIPQTSV